MEIGRHEIENALHSICRRSSCLFDNERKRIRFVQETELPLRRDSTCRVSEQSAAEKIAMEVGNERSDIAHVHRLSLAVESAIPAHQCAHVVGPMLLI